MFAIVTALALIVSMGWIIVGLARELLREGECLTLYTDQMHNQSTVVVLYTNIRYVAPVHTYAVWTVDDDTGLLSIVYDYAFYMEVHPDHINNCQNAVSMTNDDMLIGISYFRVSKYNACMISASIYIDVYKPEAFNVTIPFVGTMAFETVI